MTEAAAPQSDGSKGRGRRFWILAIIIVAAIVVAAVLIYQASMAAFTAQTASGATPFSTGNVELSNDKSADVVFDATNLQPGDTGEGDIVVTYTGSLDSTVRLYSDESVPSTLAADIKLTITADGAAGSPWTGTLADFQDKTDFDDGILEVPMSENDEQTYTVQYEVLDSAEMEETAEVMFVWEAQGILDE